MRLLVPLPQRQHGHPHGEAHRADQHGGLSHALLLPGEANAGSVLLLDLAFFHCFTIFLFIIFVLYSLFPYFSNFYGCLFGVDSTTFSIHMNTYTVIHGCLLW